MSDLGFGLFSKRPETVVEVPAPDAPTLDAEAPLGSHRRPLGNPEHAARSYLLGLRCTCGRTSLAYSATVDASETIACPHCSNALL